MNYNMRFLIPVLLFTLMISSSCREHKQSLLQLDLQQSKVLDSLSSGSGLVFTNAKTFVVSDNMNGFFTLDTASLQYSFFGFDSVAPHIQTKDIKEDFENATAIKMEGKEWLIAFGSGSITKTREKVLLIPVDSPTQLRMIKAEMFYSSIKQKLKISTEQLNLEACFATNDSIYLLNRGTNQSISINLDDFTKMISSNFSAVPIMSVQKFELPVLDGFTASFSGACFYKADKFIFSASVERTKNWVDDGEVAGSYIGVAKTDGTILQVIPLKNKTGEMIKEKIESVEFSRTGDRSIIYAISDNDNGKSTWFRIECIGLD